MIRGVRARRLRKPTAGARRSALRSGILTGLSSLILSGSAAIAAALVAQKFGRDAETDGFFASYGVYVTLTLAAQALRLTAVPELTRTGGEAAGSYAAAVLVVGLPAVLAAAVIAEPIGHAITGDLPDSSAEVAADALPWLVAGAVGQVLAAVAAAALAVEDRFVASAVGFSGGGLAGLLVFVLLADEHGVVALAWGLALSALIALAVPLLALGPQLLRWRPAAVSRRLLVLVEAAAVPVALQALYLLGLRFAAELGIGAVTSLSYAYFFAAVLVAATATSLSVISTAELTRRGVAAEEAVEHVVHGAWLSLPLIAAAAGVFALAGDRITPAVLGDAYGGAVATELARLVVVLAPWMLAAVGFSLAFPLLYVVERSRVLVPTAIGAVLVHIPLSLVLRELWGLEGLAAALAVSTLGVLAALLFALSPHALVSAAASLARVGVVVGVFAAISFGGLSLIADDAIAAVAGLAVYTAALIAVRPRGLREAWGYVRELH
jgi:hypothetical protein